MKKKLYDKQQKGFTALNLTTLTCQTDALHRKN